MSIYNLNLTIISFFCFALFSSCGFFTPRYNETSKRFMLNGFDPLDFDNSYIRKVPITNREYLIFICWSYSSYSGSSPDYVYKLLPNSEVKYSFDSGNLPDLLSSNEYLLSNRIFNAKLIDHSCSGLDRFQIYEFYKWISDRQVEDKLYRLKYLNPTLYAAEENSFSLEAFHSREYYGEIFDSRRRPRYTGVYFLHNFRPPFKKELDFVSYPKYKYEAKGTRRVINDEYKIQKSHFLYRWNKYYIFEEKGSVFLKFRNENVKMPSTNLIQKKIPYVFCILKKSDYYSASEYIDQETGFRKDDYGKLPYRIIGSNSYGRQLIIMNEAYIFEDSRLDNSVYFLVYDNHIPTRYWPSAN